METIPTPKTNFLIEFIYRKDKKDFLIKQPSNFLPDESICKVIHKKNLKNILGTSWELISCKVYFFDGITRGGIIIAYKDNG